jgi:uncharacterized protein (TIGR04255 family)
LPEIFTSPIYPRAPITEAVIEIIVTADAEPRTLERIAHRVKAAYPNSQPLQEFKLDIPNTGGQVSVSQNTHGFRLANNDQTDVILLKSRGITVARLPPYQQWNHLRDRAHAVWQEWRAATPSHPIARIGVRYINRIDIPHERGTPVNVEDYLSFVPSVAAITEQPMLGYLMQVVIPTFDPYWIATITTTALGDTPIPAHASFILDIDVARTTDIPLNDKQLWPIVDQAQVIKNDIFERCIKEPARKLFLS